MTPAQRARFYFPTWNTCCHANDWYLVKGRMMLEARREDPDAPEMAQVWTTAAQAAQLAQMGLTPDHLRHACHIVALQRDKSANDLNNQEVNRVVDLFHLLQDPTNLDYRMRWDDADLSRIRSMISFIEKRAPAEYIEAIVRDKFHIAAGIGAWRDMPLPQLRSLAAILAHRNAAWRRPVEPVAALCERQNRRSQTAATINPPGEMEAMQLNGGEPF